MLPDFFFCSLFPAQQTTSGIVHRYCLKKNLNGHTVVVVVLLFLTFSALVANPKKSTLHGG